MSKINQIPKQSWFSLDEEIATIPPVVYSKTAVGVAGLESHTAQKTADLEPTIEASQLSKRHKAMGGQALVNNSSCHEYLALDLSTENLSDLKKRDSQEISYRALLNEHRVDRKHGYYPSTLPNPSFMMFPSFWYGIFLKGVIMALIWVMPIVLGGTILILMLDEGVLPILRGILFLDDEPIWLFWGYLGLIPLNRVLDYFEKRDWHRLFDPKEIPLHSAIKRNTGKVRIFNNRKEWADLPFNEFEGLNTLVPMGRGQQTRKLTIRHKGTGFGLLLGEGGVDGWHPALLWEYYQHYMDVTRPLPDVPFFEPYRHLDPTTKKWDEEHNRPSRFWRDMNKKEYEALVQESILVAKKYPYLEPKNISDLGWQSAGDGKHWYQLG